VLDEEDNDSFALARLPQLRLHLLGEFNQFFALPRPDFDCVHARDCKASRSEFRLQAGSSCSGKNPPEGGTPNLLKEKPPIEYSTGGPDFRS